LYTARFLVIPQFYPKTDNYVTRQFIFAIPIPNAIIMPVNESKVKKATKDFFGETDLPVLQFIGSTLTRTTYIPARTRGC
jgi:hypothetical protein